MEADREFSEGIGSSRTSVKLAIEMMSGTHRDDAVNEEAGSAVEHVEACVHTPLIVRIGCSLRSAECNDAALKTRA